MAHPQRPHLRLVKRVLLVAATPGVAAEAARLLRKAGYVATVVATEAAKDLVLKTQRFDVVITSDILAHHFRETDSRVTLIDYLAAASLASPWSDAETPYVDPAQDLEEVRNLDE